MDKLRREGKPIYIKILKGDRKGSIAKFVTDNSIKSNYYDARIYGEIGWRLDVGCWGNLVWDGRKNKIKYFLGTDTWDESRAERVWLKEYDGETVYKLFDTKALKEKLLKDPVQKDIDGNKLSIGDSVLFVNLRYGSGAVLCRGKIIRFDAATRKGRNDKQINTFYTIIQSEGGEESKIMHSETLILKTEA